MTRSPRKTAVTAVLASLGLTGAVLLAAAPAVTANAAGGTVAAAPTTADPGGGQVEPQPTGQPTVDVTVTVTVTAEPTETADPVVTVTTTVTPVPTVTLTRTVRPTRTTPNDPPATAQPTQQPVQPTQVPIQTPELPQTVTTPTPTEPPLTLPSASPSQETVPSVTPTDTSTAFEEPTPDSVAIEIRNASPEYDEIGVSRRLAVPGILLVLLVIFAVFLVQSRLQRMAHAAVRKPAPSGAAASPGPYPVLPAYAPLIGFVPR